jgi:rhamnogalacturonyl hydrolase YesR
VLAALPQDYPTRGRYERLFSEMATKLASRQGDDGLWRASLLDPPETYTPETSGTALFCHAMAWGVTNGLLDGATFTPVLTRAWHGLASSVNDEGLLGWVQGIGAGPALADESDTAPFGTGALLLAGSEMLRLERSSE